MSKKPPIDSPIKPQDIPPNEVPEQRRISPFLFIVLAVTGLTAVLGVFIAIVFALQPAQAPGVAASTALQSVEMPDGGTLSLEAVTWNSHTYDVKYETSSIFSTQNHIVRVGGHSNPRAIVLWFSCRDSGGRIRDFSWWSHTTAVDSAGNERRDVDAEAQQFAVHEHGNENSNGRPLPAVGGSRFRRIIATTIIKPLRHAGDTFPVRVYDSFGDLVGEFEIADPSPINGKYPEWEAQELPITRGLGDGLTVTLTSLTGELQESNTTRNGQRLTVEGNHIRRNFLFHQDGMLLQSVWRANSVTLNDALGNTSREYRVEELSESEPVWRMFSRFYRRDSEENFDESEKWIVSKLKVAPAGKQLHLGLKATVAGAELEIIGTGGLGKLTYKDLYPVGVGAGSLNGPIRGAMGDKRPTVPFRVESEADQHAPGKLMVDCQLPHILFRWSSPNPRPKVLAIKASDDQGRRIQIVGSYPDRGGQPAVYFLRRHHEDDSEDPITSVNVTFIVNTPRQAEFFIQRPIFRPPTLREPRRRTPQQRLVTARKQIAQHEANLKQLPENAQRNYAFAWAIVTAPEELRTPDRIAKALESAKFAYQKTPDSGAYGTTLSMALLRDGRTDEAIVRFKENLKTKRNPELPVHDLYGLALAHALAGDPDEADRVYRRGLVKHRLKDRFLWGRFEVSELRDELQTQLFKQSPPELLAEINALMDAGKEKAASAALDHYLTINDYTAWQWYRSACLQAHFGDRDAWQQRCRKLIEQFRDSDDLLTLNRVGKACLLMDEPSEEFQQEARRSFARANALFPNEFWIAVSQALLSHRKGNHAQAIAAARKALAFEKRAPDADVCLHSLLAMSTFQLGDQEAAAASLAEAGRIREEQFPQLNGKPFGSSWPNILVAEVLHRNARRMILGTVEETDETTREPAGEEPQTTTPEKEKAASE